MKSAIQFRQCTYPYLPTAVLFSLVALLSVASSGATAPRAALSGAGRSLHQAASAQGNGVIIGKVVTPDGEPVRRATVRLFGPHNGPNPPFPPWTGQDAEATPAATVCTDETGAFRAENLAPGTWWFQREAKGYFEYET